MRLLKSRKKISFVESERNHVLEDGKYDRKKGEGVKDIKRREDSVGQQCCEGEYEGDAELDVKGD